MPVSKSAVVPSPPQPASRWPGLVASLGGEQAIQTFTNANGDGGRWERGAVFNPAFCVGDENVPLATQECDAQTLSWDDDDCPTPVDAKPVALWSTVGPRSNFNLEDMKTLVEDKLSLQTNFKLEKELELGTGAQAHSYTTNQYLLNGNLDVLNSGNATPLAYALTWLQREGGARGAGQRLFIYAPPALATLWYSAQVIRKENGLLLDVFDNVIIAGPGFVGASNEDGTIDSTYDTAYAFATLTPVVRMSTIESSVTIDQTNNTAIAVAFRYALVSFDPCVQIGINVDACTPCCTPSVE